MSGNGNEPDTPYTKMPLGRAAVDRERMDTLRVGLEDVVKRYRVSRHWSEQVLLRAEARKLLVEYVGNPYIAQLVDGLKW